MKIGRNQSCPCGSGLKYKRCCGGIETAQPSPSAFDYRRMFEAHQVAERIREAQQGLGRPIIAAQMGEHQMVAVKDTMYWSKAWKSFPDFLGHYIRQVMGGEWSNAEIAKPFAERHPLMQWYDHYCRYQQETIKVPGELSHAPVTGIVACYLGLAYSLYLLAHNVELQERLVKRLKDAGNFQGAYYELAVANILIRAGFALDLEDEADLATKHCEFSATSKVTGKKYWVEAKMRAVAGYFGKTAKDGSTKNNSTERMIPHLNAAFAKPASDERIIFIDLNAGSAFDDKGWPLWAARVIERLERYEQRELASGQHAYLFVTDMGFHRALDTAPQMASLPFGLGIADFNRPGWKRPSAAYQEKQKHIDIFRIGDALSSYLQFPQTFDGRMPSEVFGTSDNRILIGETHLFSDGKGGETAGTVVTACVSESEPMVYVIVDTADGNVSIYTAPMTQAELTDYWANPDVFFGKVVPANKGLNSAFELFDWLMDCYKDTAREHMLDQLKHRPNLHALQKLSDSELLATFCEQLTIAMAPSFNFEAKIV